MNNFKRTIVLYNFLAEHKYVIINDKPIQKKEEKNSTWNTSIVNGVSNSSTIDLRTTWTYAKFSPIKCLLINQFPYSSVYAIVANGKFCVILPNARQDNSNFRIPMTSPKTKYCPANISTIGHKDVVLHIWCFKIQNDCRLTIPFQKSRHVRYR